MAQNLTTDLRSHKELVVAAQKNVALGCMTQSQNLKIHCVSVFPSFPAGKGFNRRAETQKLSSGVNEGPNYKLSDYLQDGQEKAPEVRSAAAGVSVVEGLRHHQNCCV